MDKKTKLTLIIVGAIEVTVLIFCLVVAIRVATTFDATNPQGSIAKNGAFLGTLQTNGTLLFFVIVFPALLIFLVDGGYLIYYAVKRESTLNEKEKSAIEEEAKRQAREEVLKELKAEQEKAAQKPEEVKPQDPGEKK
jgi:hypothetical protein